MKTLLLLMVIAVVGMTNSGYSQEWRDTLNRARELYKGGKYKEALKYYKSAERLAPNDVDLSEEKGQSAYRAGSYKEAEQAFQSAAGRLKDKKRKSSAYNNMGNARMKQQDYASAEEAYKESLRLNPEHEKARQGLAEAKRLKKKQEDEQKKQQQNNDQSEENQGENGNNNSSSSKGKKPQAGSNGQKKQSGSQQNDQSQEGDSEKGSEKKQSQPTSGGQKLSDKQTERKLDELVRQEMEAKKRLDGAKGKTNGTKAKKDW